MALNVFNTRQLPISVTDLGAQVHSALGPAQAPVADGQIDVRCRDSKIWHSSLFKNKSALCASLK